VVAISTVKNNVGVGSLLSKELSVVKCAIDEAGLGVLGGDLGTLVAVADQSGDLKVRVGVCNGIEGIASNVAGCART
jgi:hypothetical protein